MRMFIALSWFLLSFVCVFVTPAMADGPLPSKGMGSGDWNGKRTRAEELGLTLGWMQDVTAQQNVRGGISKGGAANTRITVQANYQFEPLTPLKGSEIQVSAAWNIGGNVNNNVGALLSSTGIYRETAIRLFNLYWGQSLADEQVHFKIGRIQMCNEYAYSELYLSGAISNGYYCNPGGFYLNQPVYAQGVFPIATWGARIKVAPKKQDFEFWLGVYNGSESENLDAASAHGVNFKMNLRESTFVQGSFWYKLNQDPEDEGLPGNYRITGFYDSGSFTRFDNGQTQRRNPGWSLVVDQMLFRERSGPRDQGLFAMANFVHHPKTVISLAPYWASAGLYYKGAIPHRDADMVSFAFYYASLSADTPLDYEFQFRIYYTFQLTRWLIFSPHVHYFKKPGGGQVPSALVFGAFLRMNL